METNKKSPVKIEVGKRFKRIRLALGYDNALEFCKVLGELLYEGEKAYDNGTISSIENGHKDPPARLLKILESEFQINPKWILENKGEMRLTGNLTETIVRVPVLDAEAAAGADNQMEMSPHMHPGGYVDVGDLLRDSETAMYVYGNSMTPNYPSGCLIGLRRNYDGYIQPGETYVIETNSNRVIKRLYWNSDKTAYECHSDNTMMYETGPRKGKYFYEPFEILLSDIIRLFDVVGIIKRNRNSKIS